MKVAYSSMQCCMFICISREHKCCVLSQGAVQMFLSTLNNWIPFPATDNREQSGAGDSGASLGTHYRNLLRR